MFIRMKPDALLFPAPKGLYCQHGDFYIDPVQPVERALITHGHSDHARAGHGHVLATRETLDIMRLRYGDDFCGASDVARFGETISIGGVRVRFHPAGHVLGSAQISVEADGTRIVVSGDYKRRPDPTCPSFEPVACDVFITEATFGLPVFHHPTTRERSPGSSSLSGSFPSARMWSAPTPSARHNASSRSYASRVTMNRFTSMAPRQALEYYQSQGIDLGDIRPATLGPENRQDLAGAIVLGPPAAFAERWARRFADPLAIFASGWMLIRQRAKQRGVELPLVISDHCDWAELTATIREIAPAEVWVTHGREEALVRWCQLQGIPARPLHLVGYDDEGE